MRPDFLLCVCACVRVCVCVRSRASRCACASMSVGHGDFGWRFSLHSCFLAHEECVAVCVCSPHRDSCFLAHEQHGRPVGGANHMCIYSYMFVSVLMYIFRFMRARGDGAGTGCGRGRERETLADIAVGGEDDRCACEKPPRRRRGVGRSNAVTPARCVSVHQPGLPISGCRWMYRRAPRACLCTCPLTRGECSQATSQV